MGDSTVAYCITLNVIHWDSKQIMDSKDLFSLEIEPLEGICIVRKSDT